MKEKIYDETIWGDNVVGFVFHYEGEEEYYTEWYSLTYIETIKEGN